MLFKDFHRENMPTVHRLIPKKGYLLLADEQYPRYLQGADFQEYRNPVYAYEDIQGRWYIFSQKSAPQLLQEISTQENCQRRFVLTNETITPDVSSSAAYAYETELRATTHE